MEDGDNPELRRLRALGTWMREVGASELSLGDVHIRLGPQSRVRLDDKPIDPDEKAELTAEERELAGKSAAERDWFKQWRRIVRSSGAPIPPFPGAQ